jgi:DNA replication and repair protein RecF
MKITYLKLLNFRNYDQLTLNFSLGNNIIYGQNGVGKTNLVEAIYCLALTKSFRLINDKNLIKDGQKLTKVQGTISDDINTDYQIIIDETGKKAKINNNLVHKISDYISKINIVLFNPDDLQFIKANPNYRRKNINIDISEIDNNYLKILSEYNKVLKQRNAYLKALSYNGNNATSYLDILTAKLIDYGLIIYSKRYQFIKIINNYIGEYYNKICHIDNLSLKYASQYQELDKMTLLKKYHDLFSKEISFGKTLIGIHHDDIYFKIGNKELKNFGSEGQQKNAIIAYKLAEIKAFIDIKKKQPILILDDLFSELDQEKVSNILNLLNNDIQTFITTTEIDKVSDFIKNNSKIFHIDENHVEEVKL